MRKKKKLTLMIPLEPVEYSLGQNRNRIFAHHKKDKLFVKDRLQAALPDGYIPLTGPIGISVKFFLSPRTAVFSGCRETGDFFTEAPDLSNLVKFIEDVMTDLVYRDDRQIVRYIEPFTKEYDKENPRTEVTVYELSK